MAITIAELLEAKDVIKAQKDELVDLNVSGVGVFTFRIPTTLDISDAREFMGGGYDEEYLVYSCCVNPALSNAELMEGFGAKTPVDLMHEMFLPGVISKLAEKLIEYAGYNNHYVKEVEKVKN